MNPDQGVSCPPWCALPPGHAYDLPLYDGDDFVRVHERHVCGDQVVSLAQVEHALSAHGPIDPDTAPPLILTPSASELTADQARALAAQLTAAADLLDQIHEAVRADQ